MKTVTRRPRRHSLFESRSKSAREAKRPKKVHNTHLYANIGGNRRRRKGVGKKVAFSNIDITGRVKKARFRLHDLAITARESRYVGSRNLGPIFLSIRVHVAAESTSDVATAKSNTPGRWQLQYQRD